MAQQTPQVHSKNAATGQGQMPRVPGNVKSPGPSNHNPRPGKQNYYDEQQQTQERE